MVVFADVLQLVSNVGFFTSHRRSMSLPAGTVQSSSFQPGASTGIPGDANCVTKIFGVKMWRQGGGEFCNWAQQTSEAWRAKSIEKKRRKGKAGASFAGGQGASAPQAVSPKAKVG